MPAAGTSTSSSRIVVSGSLRWPPVPPPAGARRCGRGPDRAGGGCAGCPRRRRRRRRPAGPAGSGCSLALVLLVPVLPRLLARSCFWSRSCCRSGCRSCWRSCFGSRSCWRSGLLVAVLLAVLALRLVAAGWRSCWRSPRSCWRLARSCAGRSWRCVVLGGPLAGRSLGLRAGRSRRWRCCSAAASSTRLLLGRRLGLLGATGSVADRLVRGAGLLARPACPGPACPGRGLLLAPACPAARLVRAGPPDCCALIASTSWAFFMAPAPAMPRPAGHRLQVGEQHGVEAAAALLGGLVRGRAEPAVGGAFDGFRHVRSFPRSVPIRPRAGGVLVSASPPAVALGFEAVGAAGRQDAAASRGRGCTMPASATGGATPKNSARRSRYTRQESARARGLHVEPVARPAVRAPGQQRVGAGRVGERQHRGSGPGDERPPRRRRGAGRPGPASRAWRGAGTPGAGSRGSRAAGARAGPRAPRRAARPGRRRPRRRRAAPRRGAARGRPRSRPRSGGTNTTASTRGSTGEPTE